MQDRIINGEHYTTEVAWLTLFISVVFFAFILCSLMLRLSAKLTLRNASRDETEILNWGLECSERYDAGLYGQKIVLQERKVNLNATTDTGINPSTHK